MDPKPLFKTIVEIAVFLELSDDSVLNPDVAVEEMERIAATLQDLDTDLQNQFIEYVDGVVKSDKRIGADQTRIEFLESLPDGFGLLD